MFTAEIANAAIIAQLNLLKPFATVSRLVTKKYVSGTCWACDNLPKFMVE